MTLDNGLSLTELARSMLRVFASCTQPELAADDIASLVLDGAGGAGWVGAAAVLVGEYQASEQAEQSFRVSELADRVRAAFHEAAELPLLPAGGRDRLAWEAVTRHAAGAVGCDEAEVSNLLAGEGVWPSWLASVAGQRGIDIG